MNEAKKLSQLRIEELISLVLESKALILDLKADLAKAVAKVKALEKENKELKTELSRVKKYRSSLR